MSSGSQPFESNCFEKKKLKKKQNELFFVWPPPRFLEDLVPASSSSRLNNNLIYRMIKKKKESGSFPVYNVTETNPGNDNEKVLFEGKLLSVFRNSI
uniref:Uncharacterized protein n=1 Tax=Caenorhabditis tropicalis TaxID=1561998 RepID=A0A1I7UM36_9PELO